MTASFQNLKLNHELRLLEFEPRSLCLFVVG
jgi:hypothetical protein